MEKLDYKKQFKELYMPSAKPSAVDVPEMIFFAVKGCGDPNTSEEYKAAMELLYAMSFTVKMSKMNGTQPEGYFEYVVPPLEGLWYQEDTEGIDYSRKNDFKWISMIRQPEFVTEEVFENARAAVQKKKPHLDTSKVQLMKWCEGLCIQLMHTGTYDDEPASQQALKSFGNLQRIWALRRIFPRGVIITRYTFPTRENALPSVLKRLSVTLLKQRADTTSF